MVMFLLALQWGSSEYGWSSPHVILLFAGSGMSLIVLTFWERHVGDRALIPLHLLKRRIVLTGVLYDATLFANNFVGVTYVPIYFQAVKGLMPSLSGIYTTLPDFHSVTGADHIRLSWWVNWASSDTYRARG